MKYIKLLKNIGLTTVQAEILDYLLNTDKEKASIIAKKIKRPRGVVYNSLDELLKLGLITKKDAPNQVSTFSAEHPAKLSKLLEQYESDLKQKKNAFESVLPNMISNYNLAHNKPGVRFYEGIEGIKKVIWDTLSSQTDIYTYTDLEKIDAHIKDINREYSKKRDRLKIRKKALLTNSEYARNALKNYATTNLEVRFIRDIRHFATIMQIYDNKVSYITLNKDKMIGIIIQDQTIYNMHKSLFESMWKTAERY